jgi:hypothetical protein
MKLNRLAAIPAIAIAAGIGLAACGSVKTPVAKPAVTVTHTVAAKPVPAKIVYVTAKPAPAKTVYVQAPAPTPTEAPAAPAPVAAPTTPPNPDNNTPASGAAFCTTVNGYYSGGLPGHVNSQGECVPDGQNGDQ